MNIRNLPTREKLPLRTADSPLLEHLAMRVAKKLAGIKRLSRAEKGIWRGATSEHVIDLNHYLCP